MKNNESHLQDVVVPWAESKEEFLPSMRDGQWVVTEENELTYVTDDNTDSDFKIKDSLFFGFGESYSTGWVRIYFQEKFPELDFDEEFSTDEPGVFGRIQERFGYDYQEWIAMEMYNSLTDQLHKLGYRIHWEQ